MVAPPLYLHVGLMKSGTTYLQNLLRANADQALAHGVGVFPRKRGPSFRMALDLRGLAGSAHRPDGKGSFQRFPARLARAEGDRIIFSEEVLAGCTTEEVARLGEAVGEREVHLILTLRDVARTIPSMWEQAIKGGGQVDYETYVRAVVTGSGRGAHHFWASHDAAAILARWSTLVPPERTHIIPVPPPGASRDLLRDRFCSVLDLDPSSLVNEPRRTNDSLGRTQVEVLRRIHEKLPPEARGGDLHGRLIKRPFAFGVLAEQPAEKIRLPREYADWCEQHAEATIAALRDGGYRVVGDLAELLPDASVYGDGFAPVDEAAVAESAVDGLAAIMADRVSTHLAEKENATEPAEKETPASVRARGERADAQAALVSEPSRGRVRNLAVRAVRKARSLT